MKLPRPRFTLRWLMVAVAIVATLTGAWVEVVRLQRKAIKLRAQAQEHAATEAMLRSIIVMNGPAAPIDISPGPSIQSKRFTAQAVADHEAALKRKYERAARSPWLPVAPDPPEPE